MTSIVGPNRRRLMLGVAGLAVPVAGAVTPAQPAGPPAPAHIVHSFALMNEASAPSAGFVRVGIPFKFGDVPAGTALQIRRGSSVIAAQFDERATYPDGSLHFTPTHLRDDPFAAGESRTYDIWTAPAAAFDNAGTKVLAAFYGYDFKVVFTSLTETDNTPTTTPVGSGTFTGAFNAHAGVPTRTEKYHSGGVCEGWTSWGMATDNTGGSASADLKIIHYNDIWKNADGSIYGYEVGAVVSQDWWNSSHKRCLNYSAALRDGHTTLGSYANVQHPYNSQWLTCVNDGGQNRGKRFWVGGATPTLTYKPDQKYWIKAGVMPPLKLTGLAAGAIYTDASAYPGGTTYTPVSTQGHRYNVQGTGGYLGEGLIPNPDCIAFIRQSAADVAAARLIQMAGLHIPYHYRSGRPRTRPGDSAADVANTPVSLIMNAPPHVGGVPAFDFTAAGMPPPVHAYNDSNSAYNDGATALQGGTGVWDLGDYLDASHGVNFHQFMYLLEGERYLIESQVDLAMRTIQALNSTIYGARPQLPYQNFIFQNVPNTPAGQYDATGLDGQQERIAGRAVNIIGPAAGLISDGNPASGMMKRLNAQQGILLSDWLKYMPPDALAAGAHPVSDYTGITAHWMVAFNTGGCYNNYALTREPYIKAWADHTANLMVNIVENNMYIATQERLILKQQTLPYDPVSNKYLTEPKTMANIYGVDGPSGTINFSYTYQKYWALTAGDVLYVDSQYGAAPPELVPGTPYYVLSPAGYTGPNSTQTCKISATPGGPAITFATTLTPSPSGEHASDTTGKALPSFALAPKSAAAFTVNANPPVALGSDDHTCVIRAALVAANGAGYAPATDALVSKIQTFLAPTSDAWRTWEYAPVGS